METTLKAIISNRIYLKADELTLNAIKDKLTYKIEKPSFQKGQSRFAKFDIVKTYRTFGDGILAIPVGRTDLIPEGYELVDKRTVDDIPYPSVDIPLREDQQLVVDSISGNAIINAKPGWGKTYTAIALAKKLAQKTLVVTHTTALREQWREEVEKLLGFTPGIIGNGEWDYEDHVVVLANIQTLAKDPARVSREFGTIIIDECHHVPATTFSKLLDSSYAKYKIGLSGTITRKDGYHVVLTDYFGSHILQPPPNNVMEPVVRLLNCGISLPQGDTWAAKINALLYDRDYQEFIARLVIARRNLGYKVLLPAERVEFLEAIKEIIGEDCVLLTGKHNQDERKEAIEQILSGKKGTLAASRQIISEGISINPLSSLILPSPIANKELLEQIVARVTRKHETKSSRPEVIDIQFNGPVDKKQNRIRQAFYIEQGWDIITY